MLAPMLAALCSMTALAGGVWVGWLTLGRPTAHPPSRDVFVAAWIGWYIQGLAVLLAGWLGLLSPVWLALVLLIPAGGAFLDREAFGTWLGRARADYRRILTAPAWAWILAGAVGGWFALQLSAPPFHYDLLTYGFGQPLHWLSEGRIGPVGPDMYAYEAVPSRMHFLLALGLAGAPMASFSLLLWTLAGALLVARVIAELAHGPERESPAGTAHAPWPLLAASALLMTPAVWDLLLLRKDDLSAIWGGAALLLLHVGLRHARRLEPADIIGLALASAATLAAKPAVTAAYTLALLALTCRRSGGPRWAVSGALVGALAAAALVPIAIHSWLGLGHVLAPALPYLSRYEIASTRWSAAIADAYPFQPQSLDRLLPYALREFGRFFNPTRWNFGDNLGLVVLIGLPPALLFTRWRQLALLWLAGIAGWFLTFHWPRFSLVLLPLEIVLVLELLRRTRLPAFVAGVLAVAACLHGLFYAGLTVTGARVFRPALRAAFAGGPAPGFVPPSVKVCEQINANLDPQAHRLLFVGETRTYPCAVPYDFWNAHFRHPFERVRHGVAPEVTWDRHIAERGITHIVYSPEVARRRMEWSPAMHLRFERWLGERGRVAAREQDRESTTFLVELTPAPG